MFPFSVYFLLNFLEHVRFLGLIYKENERSCNANKGKDNVMYSKQKFDGKCYKYDQKRHKSSECWMFQLISKTFSVSAEVDNGGKVNLGPQVSMYTTEEESKFQIKRKCRLYYLNSISSSTNNASTIQEWHKILGHCNYADIRELEKVVKRMKITDHRETDCKVCMQGKMCQTRNCAQDQQARLPLEFVHCILARPIEPKLKTGISMLYPL